MRPCRWSGDLKGRAGSEAVRPWRGPARRSPLLSRAGDDSTTGDYSVGNPIVAKVLAQLEGHMPKEHIFIVYSVEADVWEHRLPGIPLPHCRFNQGTGV